MGKPEVVDPEERELYIQLILNEIENATIKELKIFLAFVRG